VIRSPWTTNVVPSNATASNVTIIKSFYAGPGVVGTSNVFQVDGTNGMMAFSVNRTNNGVVVGGNVLDSAPLNVGALDIFTANGQVQLTTSYAKSHFGWSRPGLSSITLDAGNVYISQRQAGLIYWAASSDGDGAKDLNLSRAAVGVLEIGNSSSATYNGSLLASNAWLSGTLAVTNSISNLPTNQAPTSVTIGVTVPDAWVWFTNSGTAFSIPAWKNH
jgi:hypothetical protein